MAADIFTKAFTDKAKWLEVCHLVNIVDKDIFYELIAASAPDPDGGGIFSTADHLNNEMEMKNKDDHKKTKTKNKKMMKTRKWPE